MSEGKKNGFHSQAYLMWLLGQKGAKQWSSHHESPHRGDYQRVKKIKGIYEPESVVSSIMSKSKRGSSPTGNSIDFFDLQSHKLSMLVPEIRLYKILDGGALIPFYFPIVSDFDPLENNSAEYTGYVGGNSSIDSFSVLYQGTDPFTSQKWLKCSLSISVDSLANIFIKKDGYARLADLFSISLDSGTETKIKGGKVVTAGNFRTPIEIGVDLGYSFLDPEGLIFTDEEASQIEQNRSTFVMNVSDHTINVKSDGTATIDIEYTARLDTLDIDRKSFSIFTTTEDVIDAASARVFGDVTIKPANETREKKETDDEKSERLRKTMSEKQAALRRVSLLVEGREFIFSQRLSANNLARYSNPRTSQMRELSPQRDYPREEVPPLTAAIGPNQENIQKAWQKIKGIMSNNREVYYFLLGDLIEAFIEQVENSLYVSKRKVEESKDLIQKQKSDILKEIDKKIKAIKNLTILLPDIDINYPDSAALERINLADMPISIDLYQKFIFNEIINISSDAYTVKKFINHCHTVLLKEAFGGFHDTAPYIISNHDMAMTATTFTAPKVSGKKDPMTGWTSIDVDDIPKPNTSVSPQEIKEGNQYFIIYPQPSNKTAPTGNGDKKEDLKKGIYHFHLGKDRGIIKNITFNKFEIESRRESLMVNQIGLYDELKMPYSANISMFGNNLFMPGSQLYIDPFSLGFGDPRDKDSAARALGLGGYYVVLGVRTAFSNGNLSTTLECSFASFPDPEKPKSFGIGVNRGETKADPINMVKVDVNI